MKINNDVGLSVGFLENGSLESIEANSLRISMRRVGSYLDSGTQLFLRKRNHPPGFFPLIGPGSKSKFKIENNCFFAKGEWEGLEYCCTLLLGQGKTEWQWIVDISNKTETEIRLDLILVQDAGLRDQQTGTVNEYYVSQYIERLIFTDELFGEVICCRQNMRQSTGHPWLMMACLNGAWTASVDGMQFFGKSYRETAIPEGLLNNKLGGLYAGESSVLALQEKPFVLKSGQKKESVFRFLFLEDHPHASAPKDLLRLREPFPWGAKYPTAGQEQEWFEPAANFFNPPQYLRVEDLTPEELELFFGPYRRHEEIENGKLLSFFKGDHAHVVLRTKEVLCDRPHGHIMQANTGLLPDENIVSSNAFACGIFNSHLTQGNTNFNVLLSIYSNAFNRPSETGQRIFVKTGGHYCLLGIPSAFEMGLNYCRWIYKSKGFIVQVRSWTTPDNPAVNLNFKIIRGSKPDILVSHHLDEVADWQIRETDQPGELILEPGPESPITEKFPGGRFRIFANGEISGLTTGYDELLRCDGKQTRSDILVFDVRDVGDFSINILGELCEQKKKVSFEDADIQFEKDCLKAVNNWKALSRDLDLISDSEDILAFRQILPWFGMNALIHYLTPYGLEQFGGAAWGTRDVAQGPVDLLLTFGKNDAARRVLCTLFSNQNTDGGWPQWWMFDRYYYIRASEAHGDIIYWPIIALVKYVNFTGDFDILKTPLPWFLEKENEYSGSSSLKEHVDRLITLITGSFVSGTSLVPFGGGDWNDSLQPVNEELAKAMVSSWTVQICYQALDQWARVMEKIGFNKDAEYLKEVCMRIRSDFNRLLVRDGIVAGYGLFESDGSIRLLLHPSDSRTGVRFSILPMNRGVISGIFSPEQAKKHAKIIKNNLEGPDGARLMDRPLKYRGGVQTIFQRAESSTFFGREIGLMYIHEHLRYAESLARTGEAGAFVKALRQAIPLAYRDVVPQGNFRQANCYYSSSDVVFKSRYEADDQYNEIMEGKRILRGGWRVYSSGSGIFIGLIVSGLLGIRMKATNLVVDPVMPYSFDGLTASLNLMGYHFQIQYQIKNRCYGPIAIELNGESLAFFREENPYRTGGAKIPKKQMIPLLKDQKNILVVKM